MTDHAQDALAVDANRRYARRLGWSPRWNGSTELGRAIVVGCGLGDDAECVASLGFPTAVTTIRSGKGSGPVAAIDVVGWVAGA